ncbi:MAG TPA: hypothetical protein VMN36_10365 [Verrucomicrobiales bacterium]|nr:hypothetical protein [Verrucomicrobiales bacterium]
MRRKDGRAPRRESPRECGWRMAARHAALTILLCGGASGEAPSFDHAFPAGVTRGETAEITLEKPAGPWPPSVWVSRKGLAVEPDPERTGILRVSASQDAAPGIFSVRFYASGGVSPPLRLTVELASSAREDEEREKAGGRAGQLLEELPVVVDGRLDPGGDVDRFGILLQAGQLLAAEAVAHALGSPIDPLLHVRGPEGNVVAFQHDGAGLDPFITWRAEQEGVHVLELSAFADPPQANIRLAGGTNCIYRLRVSRGPVVRAAEPLGVQAGAANRIRLEGWNVPENGEWIFCIDLPADAADQAPEWVSAVPGSVFPAVFPVGRGEEILESILVDGGAGTLLRTPVQITGRLAVEGEEDRYRFHAFEGRVMRFGLWSVRGRFPLDCLLTVRDGEGKELARKDALAKERGDPELVWTAPASGEYVLAVRDLMRRGGEEFRYRVSLEEDRPGCLARAKNEALALAASSSAEWELSSERRQGYGETVEAVLAGLPDGVESPATELPPGGGDFKIKVETTSDVLPGTWPVRLDLRTREPAGEGPGPPWLSGENTLWLTVQPAPAPPEQ